MNAESTQKALQEKDHRQDAKAPRKDLSGAEELLATSIVDAAIRVHSTLGPGLLERVYEVCLTRELELRGHTVQTQSVMPIEYAGAVVDAGLRLDMVVDGLCVIELKAMEKILPVHEAQLLTYLKLSKIRLGFLLNFNEKRMKDGVFRRIVQRTHGNEP